MLAEHLGVAFSERTVLESILGAEDLQTSGHLKVNHCCNICCHTCDHFIIA